jgi:hypothetical protein
MKQRLFLAALGAVMLLDPLAAAPHKAYLMAGHSNMQGFCGVHTFPQIESDPVTMPIHENQETYPNPGEPGGFSEYTRLLGCLIRDVRTELKAPKMRAVIGVLGFNGELETERYRQIEPKHIPWLREFRKAMAEPADMPEFKGQVAAVSTEKFWEPRLEELQGGWKQNLRSISRTPPP